MLVFLRHAERGDNQFPTQMSEIDYDPPITSSSGHTILQASKELVQLFKQRNIKKVRIISSKFLRCLMTAEHVSKKLSSNGISVEKHHGISHEICEYMRQDWFNKYPMEDLIFDRKEKEKYLSGIEWHESKPEKPHPFPENYVMFHQRLGSFHQTLQVPPEGECHLYVTHGFVVRQMCWRMDELVKLTAEVKYCGYAAFGKEGERMILHRAHL